MTNTISFKRVRDEYGCFSNFSKHRLKFKGVVYPTSEHFFQLMRLGDKFPDLKDKVLKTQNPKKAKDLVYTKIDHFVYPMRSPQDVLAMEMTLRIKLHCNRDVKSKLLDTGDAIIVEDTTGRPDKYWGANWNENEKIWVGQNILGNLWMKLREEMIENA